MQQHRKTERGAARAGYDQWEAESARTWADRLADGSASPADFELKMASGWTGRWLSLLIARLAEKARA